MLSTQREREGPAREVRFQDEVDLTDRLRDLEEQIVRGRDKEPVVLSLVLDLLLGLVAGVLAPLLGAAVLVTVNVLPLGEGYVLLVELEAFLILLFLLARSVLNLYEAI